MRQMREGITSDMDAVPIPESYKPSFKAAMECMQTKMIALISASDLDGKECILLCAIINGHTVPFAELLQGDPADEYEPITGVVGRA